ncbi:MAG: hypothetical protein H0W02_12350 [Ktedonobacteraceae bacterium]|nr:hypothetical protein [Ktedonobacteraceae bacterium]
MLFLRLFPRLTRMSLISLASCVCLLAGMLLASCDSASTVVSRAMPTATPASTIVSHAMSTVTTSLTPVTAPLASPPQHCALRPPPQEQRLDHLGENTNVRLVGGGPFWVYGVFYPGVLHLAQSGSQQWPIAKIVVEVGPNYGQPVTLRLREMQTGALAWWTDGQAPPRAATHILVLNPQTDTQDVGSVAGVPDVPHGAAAPGWKEWGIFPLFSVAGCYALEVSWSGGSWQSSFAVGN